MTILKYLKELRGNVVNIPQLVYTHPDATMFISVLSFAFNVMNTTFG